MWAVLWSFWIAVFIFDEFLLDIGRHIYVDNFFLVVPVQFDTTVEAAYPIDVHCLVFLKYTNQMFCMVFSHVFWLMVESAYHKDGHMFVLSRYPSPEGLP